MTRLVLLDRDGVLNEDRADYVKSPEELILIPGAAQAVARLTRAGWKTALVTNQSAIGRGLITESGLTAIHAHLCAEIEAAGGRIDAIYFCPDHPDRAGEDRKPAPGMLIKALERFNAVADETAMIGDTLRDLEAAAAAGCRRILVLTGQGRETLNQGIPASLQPVKVYETLPVAVDTMLREDTA